MFSVAQIVHSHVYTCVDTIAEWFESSVFNLFVVLQGSVLGPLCFVVV